MTSEFRLRDEFIPHVQPAYANQPSKCGCRWDSITDKSYRGDKCDSRLAKPVTPTPEADHD